MIMQSKWEIVNYFEWTSHNYMTHFQGLFLPALGLAYLLTSTMKPFDTHFL